VPIVAPEANAREEFFARPNVGQAPSLQPTLKSLPSSMNHTHC